MSNPLRYSSRLPCRWPIFIALASPSSVSAGSLTPWRSASSSMVRRRRLPSRWQCRSVLGSACRSSSVTGTSGVISTRSIRSRPILLRFGHDLVGAESALLAAPRRLGDGLRRGRLAEQPQKHAAARAPGDVPRRGAGDAVRFFLAPAHPWADRAGVVVRRLHPRVRHRLRAGLCGRPPADGLGAAGGLALAGKTAALSLAWRLLDRLAARRPLCLPGCRRRLP